jgi:hypothetical protein
LTCLFLTIEHMTLQRMDVAGLRARGIVELAERIG